MISKNITSVAINHDALFIINDIQKSSVITSNEYFKYTIFPEQTSIKVISKGLTNDHGFIYTTNNILYAFGDNYCIQSGINGSINVRPTIINYTFDSPIKSIQCGESFTLFLTYKGNVYSSGRYIFGRFCSNYLNPGKYHIKGEIRNIINTNNIRKIGCCDETGFVLDDLYYLFHINFLFYISYLLVLNWN